MAKYVEPRDLTISGLKFKLTSPEHPEQYDVFSEDGKQVGYVCLRFGYISASYPDCDGVVIYNTENFAGDGYFEKDRERIFHLSAIADTILEYIKTKEDKNADIDKTSTNELLIDFICEAIDAEDEPMVYEIIDALKENEKYRAIGTVEKLEKLQERHEKAKWLLNEERKQRRLLEEEVKKLKKQLSCEEKPLQPNSTGWFDFDDQEIFLSDIVYDDIENLIMVATKNEERDQFEFDIYEVNGKEAEVVDTIKINDVSEIAQNTLIVKVIGNMKDYTPESFVSLIEQYTKEKEGIQYGN